MVLAQKGDNPTGDLPEGHTIPAGAIKHADGKAADKWMDDTIDKLKGAGSFKRWPNGYTSVSAKHSFNASPGCLAQEFAG